jgi:hypothetical protein
MQRLLFLSVLFAVSTLAVAQLSDPQGQVVWKVTENGWEGEWNIGLKRTASRSTTTSLS